MPKLCLRGINFLLVKARQTVYSDRLEVWWFQHFVSLSNLLRIDQRAGVEGIGIVD
jgi:hypothetical protein